MSTGLVFLFLQGVSSYEARLPSTPRPIKINFTEWVTENMFHMIGPTGGTTKDGFCGAPIVGAVAGFFQLANNEMCLSPVLRTWWDYWSGLEFTMNSLKQLITLHVFLWFDSKATKMSRECFQLGKNEMPLASDQVPCFWIMFFSQCFIYLTSQLPSFDLSRETVLVMVEPFTKNCLCCKWWWIFSLARLSFIDMI